MQSELAAVLRLVLTLPSALALTTGNAVDANISINAHSASKETNEVVSAFLGRHIFVCFMSLKGKELDKMVNDLSAALNFDVDSFVSLYKLFVFVSFVYQCFFILSCKAASIDSRRRSVSCSIVDKIGLYRYNSVYIVDTITIIIYFVSRNPVWERRTRPTWHVTSMNKTEFVIKKKKKNSYFEQ